MHGPMRSNVAQGTYDEAQGTRRYKTSEDIETFGIWLV
jgi:hypothetical protein